MKTEINDIEMFFQWWLNDMVNAGYIKSWKREPETLLVEGAIQYGRYKRWKSKPKAVEPFNLFGEINYTYDYFILWDRSAEFLFYEVAGEETVFEFGRPIFIAHHSDLFPNEIISYIDVKPTNSVQQRGGKVSSAISFIYKQRLLWLNRKMYINKVVPIPMAGTGFKSALFIKTFVPSRYVITNKSGAARKINFDYILISEYVHKRQTYLENLLKNTFQE